MADQKPYLYPRRHWRADRPGTDCSGEGCRSRFRTAPRAIQNRDIAASPPSCDQRASFDAVPLQAFENGALIGLVLAVDQHLVGARQFERRRLAVTADAEIPVELLVREAEQLQIGASVLEALQLD